MLRDSTRPASFADRGFHTAAATTGRPRASALWRHASSPAFMWHAGQLVRFGPSRQPLLPAERLAGLSLATVLRPLSSTDCALGRVQRGIDPQQSRMLLPARDRVILGHCQVIARSAQQVDRSV